MKKENQPVTIATFRADVWWYLTTVRRAYSPWRYTWACLTGWAARIGHHLAAFIRREPQPRFVFLISATAFAVLGHPPYAGWDLSKYTGEVKR